MEKIRHFALLLCAVLLASACSDSDDSPTPASNTPEQQASLASDSMGYAYELPVVFHVLYNDNTDDRQYPRQAWLSEILDSVNAAYSRNNMGIRFKMAETNEDGKTLSEKGVIRHRVDFEDYSPITFLNTASGYGDYTQNLHDFINVFIFQYDEGNRNTMGVSDLPVMPANHKLEGTADTTGVFLARHRKYTNPWGVTLNNTYINEKQPWGSINPTCIWNTLAHELGHYLGLLHTFSEDACNEDDYCSDTQNCDYNAYVDELERFIASSGSSRDITFWELPMRTDCQTGEDYHADNIMDYMYTLADNFTAQQRLRTRRVLWYCPIVPGAKLDTYSTRAASEPATSSQFLAPRLSDCPGDARRAPFPYPLEGKR